MLASFVRSKQTTLRLRLRRRCGSEPLRWSRDVCGASVASTTAMASVDVALSLTFRDIKVMESGANQVGAAWRARRDVGSRDGHRSSSS